MDCFFCKENAFCHIQATLKPSEFCKQILNIKIMVQTTQTVYQLNADDLKQCIQEIVDENIARYFSKPKEEKFLTIKQVAELLGVTEPTLWRWNKEGVLKRVKVGNKVRYKESDVNKVLEEMA